MILEAAIETKREKKIRVSSEGQAISVKWNFLF